MAGDRFIISVLGLKKSGKTAVCEALITELKARGYAVAAVKSSHAARLDLDRKGRDSFVLTQAGAGFLIVQAGEETLTLERFNDPGEKKPLADLLARIPTHYQFVVSEGGQADRSDAVVVCLKTRAAWKATLQARSIPLEKIIALSGPSAAKKVSRAQRRAAGSAELGRFPVVDIRSTAGREALLASILKAAGNPSPRANPAGPFA